MKTWYRAVCDTHKEMCHVMVNNPICSFTYLEEDSDIIDTFLSNHYGCSLRLVHHDEDLEKLYDEYLDVTDVLDPEKPFDIRKPEFRHIKPYCGYKEYPKREKKR